jgi:hypothetical protein
MTKVTPPYEEKEEEEEEEEKKNKLPVDSPLMNSTFGYRRIVIINCHS